jgi:hypothetical protein
MRQDNDTLPPRQFELKQAGVIDLKRSRKNGREERRYRSADSFTISRGVRSIAPSTLSWRRCRFRFVRGVALAPGVRRRRARIVRMWRIVTECPLGFGLYAS